jgi:hypothetical protein
MKFKPIRMIMVCALLFIVVLYIYYNTVQEGLVTKENCTGECTPEIIAFLNLPEEQQHPTRKKITKEMHEEHMKIVNKEKNEKRQRQILLKEQRNNQRAIRREQIFSKRNLQMAYKRGRYLDRSDGYGYGYGYA